MTIVQCLKNKNNMDLTFKVRKENRINSQEEFFAMVNVLQIFVIVSAGFLADLPL